MEILISSKQNPTIKRIYELQSGKHRKERRQFIAEGTKLLREALAADWPIDSIAFTSLWQKANARLLNSIGKATQKILVTDQVLSHLASTENPDGVVAAYDFGIFGDFDSTTAFDPTTVHSSQAVKDSRTTSIRQKNAAPLAVFCESIQDPGNLGSIIRTCVACGVVNLAISPDSCDPTNSKVLRSSAGMWFRTPPIRIEFDVLLKYYRSLNWRVLGTASKGKSLWRTSFDRPTLIVLGNEGNGIDITTALKMDDTIAIPIRSEAESLNVAVAGAIILFEASRQSAESKATSDHI